jgi:hypothetical protein
LDDSASSIPENISRPELRGLEDDESDPRPARKYFNPFKVAATPKGVQNILTIGAEKQ